MMTYLISEGGEPVALVADLEMARAIARCQPWGEYLVEALEVGEPIAARRPRIRPSAPAIRLVGPSPGWRGGAREPATSPGRVRRRAH